MIATSGSGTESTHNAENACDVDNRRSHLSRTNLLVHLCADERAGRDSCHRGTPAHAEVAGRRRRALLARTARLLAERSATDAWLQAPDCSTQMRLDDEM